MILRERLRSLQRAETIAAGALRPWVDLAIRLLLAQGFLALKMHQMLGTSVTAPSSGLLHDVIGSSTGLAVQAICPILLALGVATRPVAAALLLQVVLTPVDAESRLFQAVLLIRAIVLGPGALSLDRLLHHGADSLAVPGAARLHAGFAWIAQVIGPAFQLGLRLWLAAAPVSIALGRGWINKVLPMPLTDALPAVPPMVSTLPPSAALGLGLLLAIGAGTRPVALVLLLLVPLGQLAPGDARLTWALLLLVLAVQGGGPCALDGWIAGWLCRGGATPAGGDEPHVVVIGGGFGGLAAVRGLRGAPCRITLIDRRNHHLFQPLLYQVATAGLSPADIATPVRSLLRGQANVRVLLGEVTGVDTSAKTVQLDRGLISYDHLVLATGARHSYFGREDWAPHAPGLKSVEDATAIRRRLLLAFEEAENAQHAAERQAWLTFVIVGGGPTGVELAGAIAELARHGLDEEFREIDPRTAIVMLVQSGPRLLPTFPATLSLEAERALRQLGVQILLDRRVEAIGADTVTVSGQIVAARTVLWAAGVMASPAAAWLNLTADRAGRVPVDAHLAVPGVAEIYAVGDTAASNGWSGRAVPGLAPAAKQGGAYVARVIRARLGHGVMPGPFRYRHQGSLATIGRQSAVADFGFVRFRGAFAWWLWGAAHIVFLVGGRNRMAVLLQWLWAYLTFRRGTRLITDPAGPLS